MNRLLVEIMSMFDTVPRMRGDEPRVGDLMGITVTCSPHARG